MTGANEVKGQIWRENGMWTFGLELEPWIAEEFLHELEHRCLVELNLTVNVDKPTLVEFVQMPLDEATVRCDNCGKELPVPQLNLTAPLTWRQWWSELWQLLKIR